MAGASSKATKGCSQGGCSAPSPLQLLARARPLPMAATATSPAAARAVVGGEERGEERESVFEALGMLVYKNILQLATKKGRARTFFPTPRGDG